MPAPDSKHVRYILFRVSNGGLPIGSVFTAKEQGIQYYKQCLKMDPIWATLIQFNKQTGEAITLAYDRGPTEYQD